MSAILATLTILASHMNYLSFLSALEVWARNHPHVLSCGIVGSYARGAQAAHSDVDVCLLGVEVSAFLSGLSWVDTFGSHKTLMRETCGSVETVRVFFRNIGS